MNTPPIFRVMLVIMLVSGLAIFAFFPGLANPYGGITITNADGTRTDLPTSSPELNNEVDAVGPHFQIQFSESLRNTILANVPAALQALLNGVNAHIQIQFAESNRTLISLAYPEEIITDTTPPQVTAITATPIGDGSMTTITWATNEFADSVVLYGTQAGNLDQMASDPLYEKNHTITLSGLTPGVTYFFKIRSTDRAGNIVKSTENDFVAVATHYVYMPLVRR